MWRVLGVIERMGHTLGEAAATLEVLVETVDVEMTWLGQTLASDAQALREVVAQVDITDGQRDALIATVERIELTAQRVGLFAHRPSDAEKQLDHLLAADQ